MRSNRAAFSDVCSLVTVTEVTDAAGYVTETRTERTVFCSIADGVSRKEMYEAMKAGVQLSATAEIWEDDYNKERVLKHGGSEYRIIRVYPSGHGTLELTLQEVLR